MTRDHPIPQKTCKYEDGLVDHGIDIYSCLNMMLYTSVQSSLDRSILPTFASSYRFLRLYSKCIVPFFLVRIKQCSRRDKTKRTTTVRHFQSWVLKFQFPHCFHRLSRQLSNTKTFHSHDDKEKEEEETGDQTVSSNLGYFLLLFLIVFLFSVAYIYKYELKHEATCKIKFRTGAKWIFSGFVEETAK